MYGERSLSQKAALILEIVSWIMLLPACFGLFLAALVFFGSLASANPLGLLVASVPFALAGIGVVLLIGYHKHANGSLDDGRRLPLWAGSFAFNALPLVLCAYLLTASTESIGLLPMVVWWIAATLVSALGFVKDYQDQKYR